MANILRRFRNGGLGGLGGNQTVNLPPAAPSIAIGQLFWDTNNTPKPGKLFAGGNYLRSENPLLLAQHAAQPHEFLALNPDGTTFDIAPVSEFLKAGTADIGKFFVDRTSAKDLSTDETGEHRHDHDDTWPNKHVGRGNGANTARNGRIDQTKRTEPAGKHKHHADRLVCS